MNKLTIDLRLLSDTRLRYMDADESLGNTNWMLGDFRSLHRCVPALRRTGITFLFPFSFFLRRNYISEYLLRPFAVLPLLITLILVITLLVNLISGFYNTLD